MRFRHFRYTFQSGYIIIHLPAKHKSHEKKLSIRRVWCYNANERINNKKTGVIAMKAYERLIRYAQYDTASNGANA